MKGHALPGFKQRDVLNADTVGNLNIRQQLKPNAGESREDFIARQNTADTSTRGEMNRLSQELGNTTSPTARDSISNLYNSEALSLNRGKYLQSPALPQKTGDDAGENYLRPREQSTDSVAEGSVNLTLPKIEALQERAYNQGDTAQANYWSKQYDQMHKQLVKDGKLNVKTKPKFGGGWSDNPNVKGGY